MAKIAVSFHSGYGHTPRMAEAVAEGAVAEGNISDAAWANLVGGDAIIMGLTTCMGSVSWQF